MAEDLIAIESSLYYAPTIRIPKNLYSVLMRFAKYTPWQWKDRQILFSVRYVDLFANINSTMLDLFYSGVTENAKNNPRHPFNFMVYEDFYFLGEYLKGNKEAAWDNFLKRFVNPGPFFEYHGLFIATKIFNSINLAHKMLIRKEEEFYERDWQKTELDVKYSRQLFIAHAWKSIFNNTVRARKHLSEAKISNTTGNLLAVARGWKNILNSDYKSIKFIKRAEENARSSDDHLQCALTWIQLFNRSKEARRCLESIEHHICEFSDLFNSAKGVLLVWIILLDDSAGAQNYFNFLQSKSITSKDRVFLAEIAVEVFGDGGQAKKILYSIESQLSINDNVEAWKRVFIDKQTLRQYLSDHQEKQIRILANKSRGSIDENQDIIVSLSECAGLWVKEFSDHANAKKCLTHCGTYANVCMDWIVLADVWLMTMKDNEMFLFCMKRAVELAETSEQHINCVNEWAKLSRLYPKERKPIVDEQKEIKMNLDSAFSKAKNTLDYIRCADAWKKYREERKKIWACLLNAEEKAHGFYEYIECAIAWENTENIEGNYNALRCLKIAQRYVANNIEYEVLIDKTRSIYSLPRETPHEKILILIGNIDINLTDRFSIPFSLKRGEPPIIPIPLISYSKGNEMTKHGVEDVDNWNNATTQESHYKDEQNNIDSEYVSRSGYEEIMSTIEEEDPNPVLQSDPSLESEIVSKSRGIEIFDTYKKQSKKGEEKNKMERKIEKYTLPPEAEEAFSEMLGNSAKIKEVKYYICKFANAENPILILGESGTGKEMVAKAIHRLGRPKEPFVTINAANLKEELFESELFGHLKGRFTGAIADKKGLIEHAGSGMLFLDEFATLNLSQQAKLLRFLQEKEYMRIGDDKTRHSDALIICATNADIDELVKKGEFREDLRYRLNLEINVPPLRERKEDIPILFNSFLPGYNIADDVMEFLMTLDWPGNIRQLKNVAEKIGLLFHEESITVEILKSVMENEKTRIITQNVSLDPKIKRCLIIMNIHENIIDSHIQDPEGDINQEQFVQFYPPPSDRGKKYNMKKKGRIDGISVQTLNKIISEAKDSGLSELLGAHPNEWSQTRKRCLWIRKIDPLQL